MIRIAPQSVDEDTEMLRIFAAAGIDHLVVREKGPVQTREGEWQQCADGNDVVIEERGSPNHLEGPICRVSGLEDGKCVYVCGPGRKAADWTGKGVASTIKV